MRRRTIASSTPGPERALTGFASVLRVREFRWLWLANLQSIVGDQLTRVALSILVFERTGSAWWTAATYALLYLPSLLGGLLLGGLADRFPRRAVMVSCDVARAGLVGCMAVPGVPLGVLAGLLTIAVLIGSIFGSAEPALVADIFTGPRYTTALGLRAASDQAAQLVGFAVGGLAVAAVGPRPALAVDAVTFAASALLLRVGLRSRPAVAAESTEGTTAGGLLAGVRLVAGNPRLVMLLAFGGLTGLWIVAEGLAVPYAAATGGGAVAAGVLLAANPAGNVVGVTLFARLPGPERQASLVGPLSVLCGLPLIVCATRPGLGLTIALWTLSGVCSAYLVQVTAEYVPALPAAQRGQGLGVLSAAFLVAQGLGVLAGGGLARIMPAADAVAWAGGTGSALAVALTLWRKRIESASGSIASAVPEGATDS